MSKIVFLKAYSKTDCLQGFRLEAEFPCRSLLEAENLKVYLEELQQTTGGSLIFRIFIDGCMITELLQEEAI